MHDLLIRGGTIVDGTGTPSFRGNVAVRNGLIVGVGEDATGPARRTIDAEGHLVLPGWVDIHTHYDGQAMWDRHLAPSSLHGVTTAVFGNCGVGFAPVRPGSEDYLINLMEGVEDIPGSVLAEGVDFSWESFPEFIDALDRTTRTMDVAAQLPHGVLRFYVMGERGADHGTAPSADEIDRMGKLTEEALQAGALGVSTSRTTKHKAADGRMTPGLSAGQEELFGIADAMKRAGAGVFQCNTDFGPGEYEILEQVAIRSGRPLSVLLLQIDKEPNLWRQTLDSIERSAANGIAVNGQVGCRPIGIMMGIDTSVNPFVEHPLWKPLLGKSTKDRLVALADPDFRRRLIEERPDNPHTDFMAYALERGFELGDPLNYEPHPSQTIKTRAETEGRSAWELALEVMEKDDGRGLILYPFENYSEGNLEVVRTLLESPHTVCGLGDGGAHVATICDAGYPTFMLTYWARDRAEGQFPLEYLVRKQTFATAQAYGLHDRGVLARGFRADINIVDFEELALERPEIIRDLPAGGRRLMQGAHGYHHTFVGGVEVRNGGEFTGEFPGITIKGARSAPEGAVLPESRVY